MDQFDRNKTLQELEGQDWGEPNFDSSLVIACHRLRRVPLRKLNADNLRVLIGQQIGLLHLVPLALELLRKDPFTAGNCYEGDLLWVVLRVEADFWLKQPQLRQEVDQIAQRAFDMLPSLDEFDQDWAHETFDEPYRLFQQSAPKPDR